MLDPNQLAPLLISAAACAVGALAAGYGLRQRHLIERSQSWPCREGEITRSEVIQTTDHDGDTFYEARVEYRYEVNGRHLEGSTIGIGGDISTTSRGHAEERCRCYPPGVKVLVHYDPANPELACLERSGRGWMLVFAVGVVFVLAGGGFLATWL